MFQIIQSMEKGCDREEYRQEKHMVRKVEYRAKRREWEELFGKLSSADGRTEMIKITK